MIIVTGATGLLGRGIVGHLLARRPAREIGVSVRDPAKAADLAARGVRVRQGDFADPASLAHSFEGAAQVLIVSSNAASRGGDPVAHHRAAIAAARDAGAERFVYTSQMAASAASAFPPMHDHAATERLLGDSGLRWTALRNGFHASSGILALGDVAETGRLSTPADGPIAWTAHDDLAEAAAIVLTDAAGRFEGPTPPLTGAEAHDFDALARFVEEASGRPVRHDVVDDETFARAIVARGLPGHALGIAIGMYVAARNGEFASVDPTLAALLGRPPVSIRRLIGEALGG